MSANVGLILIAPQGGRARPSAEPGLSPARYDWQRLFQFPLVPEVSAMANIWWYPMEGVEVRVGYEFMNFFNTVASPAPVDFNYGSVTPAWEKGHYRAVDGINAGIAFIF